ncbi:MAG TPA: bifunctional diaminohydroxyphosphoribosylaminopyrimidine deaminase/5-amino-6-(5-phosphoribosylamino)uracil reductase RibD [Acidimicrobiales bacterium]|nr:bifunctional diaminohydroxyphosphoribosylaminopyrimidine deaminase/5-amino-6-(5-phosphoribosylamino)uracil reductase RibD [Acidimicrobiales bacterium]
MDDEAAMSRALELAASVRASAHPNPWVGAVIVSTGATFEGATEPVGGRHAEAVALDAFEAAAGGAGEGTTLYVTLEPCWEWDGKRTPSCAKAVVAAGIDRVVVAMEDPDERVRGRGVAALREAGVEVEVGLLEEEARRLLRPYVHHRTTGRPFVVLKLAASLDGRTAAPDGSSQWITGEAARADAHRLRAESDAILVGAGTVRADDPSLTVRAVEGRDPRRIVLGRAPGGAKVHPCDEMSGDLAEILDRLGGDGVVQLMVEGGASVAGEFHRRGLVDRYVVYVAPVLFGGDDARGMFSGRGALTIDDVFRGRIVAVEHLGDDIRIDLERAA